MNEHTVTCRTEGCENENIGIVVESPSQVILCGPCGQQITDIVPPLPEPVPQPEPEPK